MPSNNTLICKTLISYVYISVRFVDHSDCFVYVDTCTVSMFLMNFKLIGKSISLTSADAIADPEPLGFRQHYSTNMYE